MKNNQGGFTLVEIAIVLVIIGLLLGGVLKGQELITQAKIKNVANDLNGMSAAVYGYQDRYKKFPGDDNQAVGRWGSTTKDGDGNGSVGTAQTAILDCANTNKDDESCRFWQHLRLSGFVGGDTATTNAPQNAAGGVLQAQNGALGLSGLVICSSNLPGKIANAIDAQFDDGKPNSGQVRGTKTANALGTNTTDSAYTDDGATVYVVCRAP
jgi:prepilin-type N-terminal cleavage/methylation domain-containing protein